MDHIKKLIGRRVTNNGLAENIEKAMVIEAFSDLLATYFGQIISRKIKPLYIKNKILTVACLSSVVVQELNFKKAEMVSSINDKFQKEAIKDIKFVI